MNDTTGLSIVNNLFYYAYKNCALSGNVNSKIYLKVIYQLTSYQLDRQITNSIIKKVFFSKIIKEVLLYE
jgi:hypothetical protein